MPRNGKPADRFRPRVVVVDGEALDVVWDGRKGAPSLIPRDRPAGAVDFSQDYAVIIPRDREAA